MSTEDDKYNVVTHFLEMEEEEEESSSTESAPEQTNSPTAEPTDLDEDDETLGDDWDDDSTDEQESEQSDESEESDDEEAGEETESDESDEQTEEDKSEESTEEQPQSKAEKRKEQLNTEIRDLVAERNRIRQEVESLNGQVYQPASVDKLLETENPDTGDYYTRVEAQLEAMRQEREVERYNNQVTEARLQLQSETAKALREFPMFDETSSEYDKDAAQDAYELIEPNLIRDPNVPEIDPTTGQPTGRGVVIGSRVSPYTIIKKLAGSTSRASTRSQVKAQKATETMLRNADPSPGTHHKPTPKDEAVEAFDEEADRW